MSQSHHVFLRAACHHGLHLTLMGKFWSPCHHTNEISLNIAASPTRYLRDQSRLKFSKLRNVSLVFPRLCNQNDSFDTPTLLLFDYCFSVHCRRSQLYEGPSARVFDRGRRWRLLARLPPKQMLSRPSQESDGGFGQPTKGWRQPESASRTVRDALLTSLPSFMSHAISRELCLGLNKRRRTKKQWPRKSSR